MLIGSAVPLVKMRGARGDESDAGVALSSPFSAHGAARAAWCQTRLPKMPTLVRALGLAA
eukprot:3144198-Prymnesium_polylepis.1